jgi:aspartate oxidase
MYVKGSALRKRGKDTRKADAIRQLVSDFNAAVEELEAEGFDFDMTPIDEGMA